MIETLLLHPQTHDQLKQFVHQPAHALLLVGPDGIGKAHIAHMLAGTLMGVQAEKLNGHPYFSHLRSDKGSISIDAIRELQRFLQLKTIGTAPLRRIVIVEHAHALTTEAQNAYLKLLEEPPVDTLMILTADTPRNLLPTILSRLQTITVHPPSEDGIREYFAQAGNGATQVQQAYFLSGGLPGLMHALLTGDDTHPLMSGVAAAKALLQQTPFERLARVDALSKQKREAMYTVEALRHIARAGLTQAAAKGEKARIVRWHAILKASSGALEALNHNANTKLVLSNLMLQI